jgi:hypothetical protein
MRQTYYLHNGLYFQGAYLRNDMADRHGLRSTSSDDPVDGHGANTSTVPRELYLLDINFQNREIAVVTQISQEGE